MDKKLTYIKEIIENNYLETDYFNFAITDFHFNCKQKNQILTIEVCHYNSDLKINLVFKKFEFFLLSEETFSPHFDKEDFSGFSFVSILNKYSLVDIIKKNGFNLQFELRNKNPDDFFIFRVIAQNYFIDVFTDNLPEIDYPAPLEY